MTKADLIAENKELIETLELVMEIIYGNEKEAGLYDCLAYFYEGIWDDQLDKVEANLNRIKENQIGR